MEGSYKEKYGFLGEWYDDQASLVRRFYVFYYPTDDTLEMYDLKNRKTFVRRVKVDGVKLSNFYIGCTLHILGRLIKIVDYASENSRKKLLKDLEVTFAMIKPMSISKAGKIMTHFYDNGLRVTRMKKARMTIEDINVIYSHMITDPTYPFLLEYLSNSMVIGMEMIGKNALEHAMMVTGDRDPLKAAPGTIRALYGTDLVKNCLHLSPTPERALSDLDYYFPPPELRALRLRTTATLSNCTLCIILPHAIREGKHGAILSCIDDNGFDVTAINMMVVEMVNSAEFYEVYKGIVSEYKAMMEELSSGPCLAMEIVTREKNMNTAVEFRKLVGPADPDIAKLVRPHTLRAKFGVSKVRSAVHCSDLPEDGLLEVEYFFKILDL